MPNHLMRKFERSAVFLVLFSIALASDAAGANRYTQHNLVSDIPGIADQTDPNLVNPWGISMSPTIAADYDGHGQPALGDGRGAGDANTPYFIAGITGPGNV